MKEARFWVGIHGIVTNGAKLLVLRRAATMVYKPGHWDLPGGHLALNENFEQCLIREVREETGLVVEVGPLLGLIRRLGEPFVQALYACKTTAARLPTHIKLRPDEHAEARWISVDEIGALGPLIPYLEQIAHEGLLNGTAKSLIAPS